MERTNAQISQSNAYTKSMTTD